METRLLGERAKSQLAGVTGLKPVTVTAIHREGDAWSVRVEMLEMSRIPAASDLLGEYTVRLAEDGTLVDFERKRTRLRGEAIQENGQ